MNKEDSIQMRRLAVFAKHLVPNASQSNANVSSPQLHTNIQDGGLLSSPCSAQNHNNKENSDLLRYNTQTDNHTPTFDILRMGDVLRGPDFPRSSLMSMYQMLDDEEGILKYNRILKSKGSLCKEIARECVLQQAKTIIKHPDMNYKRVRTDSVGMLYRVGICGLLSNSLSTKLGVHMGLFMGSIYNLGTARHLYIIDKAVEFEEYRGMFLMTELGHGSNVKALETTATYDVKTQEFVIHTPDQGAIKWWAGNAAVHGNIATVFARLINHDGKDYGVHAFVVPIRDVNTHEPIKGVSVGDCGDKVGLHGVDNGMVHFDHVRIPRENLLNRFGDILPDGTYVSQFKSEGRRFGALLGELINGRTHLAVNSNTYRKLAATIAVRYMHRRRQFGPEPRGVEIPILDYKSSVVRLMPIVASCYAAQFANRELLIKFKKMNEEHDKMSDEELAETHSLSAGMKAVHTWDTQRYLQTMREMCGGHGYAAHNRFGELRDDHDIYQTFEGDNTVLVQQLGGYLMKQFAKQFQGNLLSDSYTFLRKKMGVWAKRRNPIVVRITSTTHLKSSEFQLQAFEYRTARLLQLCAQEFNAKKRKLGAFTSWSHVVPLMVNLGQAYVQQYTLEQFVRQLEALPSKTDSIYQALKLCCDVYALSVMEKSIDEFLDVIQKRKATAISNLLGDLCSEMREHAVSLVDAFEIPDFLIDAPVGLAHGNYTKNILQYVADRNPNLNNVGECRSEYPSLFRPSEDNNTM